MSIVRSLLISVGFKVNRKDVNDTNKAILGFRTKFAIAATAATYAFTKIASFFNEVAKATQETVDLSKGLGIALKDINALDKAAIKFGLDLGQYPKALLQAGKLINQNKQGFGDLKEIARGLKFEIDPRDNAQDIIKKILIGLSKIETESERIRISENIFGSELGTRISDLSQVLDKFDESFQKISSESQSDSSITKRLEEYKIAVNELTLAWNEFALVLSEVVLPVLTPVIKTLSQLLDLYKSVFSFDTERIKKSATTLGNTVEPIANGIKTGFDYFKAFSSVVLDKVTDAAGAFYDYAQNKQPMESAITNSSTISPIVTNNIEVTMPPGTSDQSAQTIGESIGEYMEDFIRGTFINIQNNNPVIE